MKKETYDKVNRKHTTITALEIIGLVLLILANLASAGQFANVPNSGNDISFNLNKSFEAVKIYEKSMESDKQDPMALYNKTLALYDLNKQDKKTKSYGKVTESNRNLESLHDKSGLSKQSLLHHIKFD